MMDVSIVVPAYNEAASLPELTDRIHAVLNGKSLSYEVIVIDDGSTDGTFQLVRKLREKNSRIRGVRFRTNSGKAAGLAAGFARATGKYVITMDADLQDDPAEIPELIAKLEEGYDLVSGWKKVRHDPIGKTVPSKFFNFVTATVGGLKLHDFNCGLKAYRNEVVKSIQLYGEMHRYVPVLAHWNGFRVTEKPVEHHPRKHGKSKYGLARMRGLLDLITIFFLNRYMKRPLHFFGVLGALLLLAGGAVLGYFGIQWAITGEMHVRPLVLLAVTAMILGIQFVSLGLLGEMITYSGRREEAAVSEEL